MDQSPPSRADFSDPNRVGKKPVTITRRRVLKGFVGAVAGSGLVVTGGYQYSTQFELNWLAVERVRVPLKKLHPSLEGLKVVLMSDFHLHPYTQIETVQEAVRIANSLQPDLVVLTGDYVLQRVESIFELAPVLAGLNASWGVFCVLGNHDIWTDSATVENGLLQSGLRLLKNSGVLLTKGEGSLYVAGLDDGWSGKPDLSRALDGMPDDVPCILLVHEPDLADEYSRDERVGLQLSGHSHGGQVRLPLIGAPILPHLGEKYDQGLYRVNDMWLYTTRGVGVIRPIRFMCRPEVTEITLVRGVS